MRKWVIDFFVDEPEEVSLLQELGFYGAMASPVLIVSPFLLFI